MSQRYFLKNEKHQAIAALFAASGSKKCSYGLMFFILQKVALTCFKPRSGGNSCRENVEALNCRHALNNTLSYRD